MVDAHTQVAFLPQPQKLSHLLLCDIVESDVSISVQANLYHTAWTKCHACLCFQINREDTFLATVWSLFLLKLYLVPGNGYL